MNAMTLTEFLLARIDEDERQVSGGAFVAESRVRQSIAAGGGPPDGWASGRRQWRECTAKRRIMAEHPPADGPAPDCERCYYDSPRHDLWPCPTLRALAAVYADHPDYRWEWAA